MSLKAIVEMLREQHGLPDTWDWFRSSWLPPERPLYLEIEGSVPTPFKTGKNKGRPNPAKRTNVRKFFLSRDEKAALEAAWGLKTGKCIRCEGEGKYAWSSSVIEGTKYRECETCKGTGKHGT